MITFIDLDQGGEARRQIEHACCDLHELALPLAEIQEFAVDAMEAHHGCTEEVRRKVDTLRGIFGRFAVANGCPADDVFEAAMALVTINHEFANRGAACPA